MQTQLAIQLTDDGSTPSLRTMTPRAIVVRQIDNYDTARRFYSENHYLGEQGFVAQFVFGAYFCNYLVGCIAFGPPSAPETVKGILDTTEQFGVFEIKRLAMLQDCPKNSESAFIARAISSLREIAVVKAIITYADSSQNHVGIIYKATGFEYLGLTAEKKDFVVNGKIKQRGKTKGVDGVWVPRPQKHAYVMKFSEHRKRTRPNRRPILA